MKHSGRISLVGVVGLVVLTGSVVSPAAGQSTRYDVAVSVDASAYSHLDAVSAVSETDVWVVGGYFNGVVSKTLIKHWDGAVWDEIPGPNPGGANGSFLLGVSALDAGDAWAVGHYGTDDAVDETLIGHWDGVGWAGVPSPNPAGSQGSRLVGVSATSADDVWAVGEYLDGATVRTLVEHWDGTVWSLVASPSPGKRAGSALQGVVAVSQNDVWAVGHTGSGRKSRTLVEHWDGAAWTRHPSPNGARGNALHAVSASSATDVWAVGDDNTTKRTLVEHWDGGDWSIVASPSPGSAALSGVSAPSGGDAWAVGTYASRATGQTGTLIEHWNGAAWKRVPSPNPADAVQAWLVGVSAVSSSDAWSAGFYDNGSRLRPVVEQWDGTDWKLV